MTMRRVLVTGATGYVAAQLLPALRERYELRLIDVKREDRSGQVVEGVEVVDLLGAARDELRPFFDDVDTVCILPTAVQTATIHNHSMTASAPMST